MINRLSCTPAARPLPQAALVVVVALLVAACGADRFSGITDLTPPEARRSAPIDPASVTFAFAPFENIPGNVGDDLTRFLVDASRSEGLDVLRRPDAPATYRVDGVASAVSDDTNSIVFYVFDIYGEDGARLHRIRGQQSSAASRGDPWAGVQSADLRIIAARVAAQIRAWLSAARA
jgi:hypothetical protein